MATATVTLTGVGGKNCNGVSYNDTTTKYTISTNTKGTVNFKITATNINEGKPVEITDVKISMDAYDEEDTFNFYFTSSEKIKAGISTTRSTISFGTTTVNYFNGLRDENNCFSASKTVTLHIADTNSSGSCKIQAGAQRLLLTYKTITPAYIHNGTEFIEATPHVYTEELWVEATPNVYTNGEWKDS